MQDLEEYKDFFDEIQKDINNEFNKLDSNLSRTQGSNYWLICIDDEASR